MFHVLTFVSSYFLASDDLVFSSLTLHLTAFWFEVQYFHVIQDISYSSILMMYLYYFILEFAPPWDCEPGMYVWNPGTGLCCDGETAWGYARDDSFQWEKSTSRTNNEVHGHSGWHWVSLLWEGRLDLSFVVVREWILERGFSVLLFNRQHRRLHIQWKLNVHGKNFES